MIRYRQTLLFVFVLMVVTGVGIYTTSQFSPQEFLASRQGFLLLLALGVIFALALIFVVGSVFASIINGLANALAEAKDDAAVPPTKAAPAGPAKKDVPSVVPPLYDNRQRVGFYAIIAVGVLLFLILRAIAAGVLPGYPLDRLPNLSNEFLNLGGTSITEGMALGGAVLAILGGVIVTGGLLAFIISRAGRTTQIEENKIKAAEEAAKKAAGPAPKAAPASKPAAAEKPVAPAVPLYDNRQRAWFYGLIAVGVFAFLLVRSLAAGVPLAYPLDRTPDLSGVFISLGGFDVSVWMFAIGALVAVIVGTVAAGFGLARLMTQYSATEKALEKAPPMWPAPQVAVWEPKIRASLAQPRRLTSLDYFIFALLGAIALIFLIFVVPSIGGVLSADQNIEATKVAALWTPTPLPGPTPTPGPSPDEMFAGLPAGDKASGEALATSNACVACHIVSDPAVALQGPAWLAKDSEDGKGIATHAVERIEAESYTGKATSAEGYLYESITNPNAYVVQGFAPNLMPGVYGTTLSPQQLADLIAYLKDLQ